MYIVCRNVVIHNVVWSCCVMMFHMRICQLSNLRKRASFSTFVTVGVWKARQHISSIFAAKCITCIVVYEIATSSINFCCIRILQKCFVPLFVRKKLNVVKVITWISCCLFLHVRYSTCLQKIWWLHLTIQKHQITKLPSWDRRKSDLYSQSTWHFFSHRSLIPRIVDEMMYSYL